MYAKDLFPKCYVINQGAFNYNITTNYHIIIEWNMKI